MKDLMVVLHLKEVLKKYLFLELCSLLFTAKGKPWFSSGKAPSDQPKR